MSAGFLDALQDRAAVIGPEGTILFANRAWRRQPPCVHGPAESCEVGDDYISACAREAGVELTDGVRSVLEGRRPSFAMEYRGRAADREGPAWFAASCNPLDDGGALVLHRDVTRRREAEEALRHSEERLLLALEAAEMGTWDWDLDTGSIVWSPGHASLFGHPPVTLEVDYEFFARQIVPEDLPEIARRLAESRDARGTFHHSYRVIRPDGVIRWIQGRGRHLYDDAGRARRMLGMVQDVTPAIEAQDRLRELSRRLVEVQEAERRHLARELHDELGQTLTLLRIQVERAVRDPSNPARLADSLGLVDRTIREVRALALDLRPSLLDELGLAEALREYVARFRDRAGLDIRLTIDPPELEVSPQAATACYRVIQEALTNVARHARARTAWVELVGQGGGLHLVVRDDGVGLDTAAQARPSAPLTLGLAGIRERVGLLGGRLAIESEPGQGVEIHATIPGPAPGASRAEGPT